MSIRIGPIVLSDGTVLPVEPGATVTLRFGDGPEIPVETAERPALRLRIDEAVPLPELAPWPSPWHRALAAAVGARDPADLWRRLDATGLVTKTHPLRTIPVTALPLPDGRIPDVLVSPLPCACGAVVPPVGAFSGRPIGGTHQILACVACDPDGIAVLTDDYLARLRAA